MKLKKIVLGALIVTLFACLATFTAACSSNQSDESGTVSENSYEYAFDEETNSYSIIGIGSVTDTELVFPESYNNRPITKINDYAFFSCTSFKSVTIGKNIAIVGDYAFSGCTALETVKIEQGVTILGDFVFNFCSALKSISISKSVRNVGDSVFNVCDNISEVETSIDLSIYIPTKNLERLIITGGSILTTLTASFPNCEKLTYVEISEDIASLNSSIFSGCDNIKEANVPSHAISAIAKDNIEKITINSGTSISGDEYSSNYLTNKKKLTTVELTDTITTIGSYAFYGCDALSNITIPASVTAIEEFAFQGCKALTSITIPSTVKKIGGHAFQGCTALAEIVISNGVQEIGTYAFSETAITTITIPMSTTKIGVCAFYSCDRLGTANFANVYNWRNSYG